MGQVHWKRQTGMGKNKGANERNVYQGKTRKYHWKRNLIMALITDKFIFVHIPKTGGTWIRRSLEALGIAGKENAEPYAYHEHDGIFRVPYELRYSRPAFAIVRHPVTRLASLWSWAMLTNFNDKIDSEPAAAGHWFAECWSKDYEEFVVKYLLIHPGLITQITLSMLGYYQKAPGLWRPSKFVTI
jgi:hypothetical protein